MFRRLSLRHCAPTTSAAAGTALGGAAAPPLSKDTNPFIQACLKVPISVQRIRNRLQVPEGERQPVQLKPLPPPQVPAGIISTAAGTTLRNALNELDGDSERISSAALSRLWNHDGQEEQMVNGKHSSDAVAAELKTREDAAVVSGRQQSLDLDSYSPDDTQQAPQQNGFNAISRDCTSRATFCGTVVFEQTVSVVSAQTGTGRSGVTRSVRELVLLCRDGENDDNKKTGVLITAQVSDKVISPAFRSMLKVGASVLLSGSLRMQRRAISDAQLHHHTVPVLDRVTSLVVVGSVGSADAAEKLLADTVIV